MDGEQIKKITRAAAERAREIREQKEGQEIGREHHKKAYTDISEIEEFINEDAAQSFIDALADQKDLRAQIGADLWRVFVDVETHEWEAAQNRLMHQYLSGIETRKTVDEAEVLAKNLFATAMSEVELGVRKNPAIVAGFFEKEPLLNRALQVGRVKAWALFERDIKKEF